MSRRVSPLSGASRSAGVPDESAPVPGPLESAVEQAADALNIKPKWRGWIHLGATPLAIAAGIVLIALAPSTAGKITSAIYAFTGILLFGISATYHRGNWAPRTKVILKRLDHTNIMLVIAGSYTPLSWALLPPDKATVLLWLIWCGAIAGVLFRVLWVNAPRWLYVPIYVVLGLAALLYLPDFLAASVPATVLICVGGVLYIAGAVIYGLKKPNPSPVWFGFHELFHAFTVAAFAAHFIAIMIAVLNAR
ncbi:hemolysin III family protein [Arthrobacter sp. JZ12]|uniref:PAQR family membrane homeostasis protein TrhA n=1 Tax=Arthrobacter sp. JZ12 TaxID=2654190 RepID=UPI002B48D1BD|nr:hemolysin III family protein [Arthrobacter sp. JZ12]WRH24371.1 hemolysin III family protein [Arthrobacter sp. JZ12]